MWSLSLAARSNRPLACHRLLLTRFVVIQLYVPLLVVFGSGIPFKMILLNGSRYALMFPFATGDPFGAVTGTRQMFWSAGVPPPEIVHAFPLGSIVYAGPRYCCSCAWLKSPLRMPAVGTSAVSVAFGALPYAYTFRCA